VGKETWTKDQKAVLRELWGRAGLSTNVIGAKIGMSGNAVTAKAHRLHLPSLPSPIVRHHGAEPTAESSDNYERSAVHAAVPAFHPVSWDAIKLPSEGGRTEWE
jgi:hypothetical protein